MDDGDGNTYNTVKIGDQCWMKENLDYDGNPDGGGCSTVTWSSSDVGACSYYSGGPYAGEGLLYQWSAAQGKCPSGWHVPTDADFKILVEGQGTAGCESGTGWQCSPAGDKLKKAGLCQGRTPCGTSGFEGLLAGCRSASGSYGSRGTDAYLWSSSPDGGNPWRRVLYVSHADVYRGTYGKAHGFSVRCLKDD